MAADEQFLKLEDHPTNTHFRDKYPYLAHDFALSLPVPMCTIEDGPLILISFFPVNPYSSPDFGPKIFAATAIIHDNYGTTRLRMDVTDVINLMANEGEALWHIFPSQDIFSLRSCLKRWFSRPDIGDDPIHARKVYLTPKHLADLLKDGIVPFTFEQGQGDYVFVM